MLRCHRLFGRRSSTRARWRLPLALAGAALALASGSARAATFYELNKPLFLGTGETSWMGKGGPVVRGEIDVATGYYSFAWPIVTLRGRHPFSMAIHFASGDNSNGPVGKGTSLSCDWFLAQSPVLAGSPYVLIAPGGRQFVFDSTPDGQGNYRDPYDPEMLGVVLDFTATPPGNLQATLRWKDGREFFFDPGGACIKMEDRHNNAVTITRNSSGFATQISLWSARFLALTYDATTGKLTQIQAKYGTIPSQTTHTWTISYNATTGRLEKITEPAVAPTPGETLFAWTSYNRTWNNQTLSLPLISQITLANGNISLTNGYDSSGRVISHRAGNQGGLWSVTYAAPPGAAGSTQVTDPRNNVTRWDYSWHMGSYGYIVPSTQDALGRTTTYERNAPPTQLVTGIVDFRGRRVSQGWDVTKGNLTSVTLPTASGGTVTYTATYEPNFSRRTSVTDPLNRTSTWNVDPATGNVTSFTDPRNAVTSFTYAANGDRLSQTNALNQTTTATYDSTTGDLLTTTDAADHTTTRSYTESSLPFEVFDANNRKVRYAWDNLERLTSETRYLGINGDTLVVTSHLYDKVGNQLSLTDPRSNSTSWTLDPYDRVIEEVDPTGKRILFALDGNSNVTRRTDKLGRWIDYSYTTGDRLSSLTCKKVGGVLESTVTLDYNATTKLLTSVTDSAFGPAGTNGSYSWAYDAIDRITGVTGPHGTVSYGLDNLGRRTLMTATGQATITYGYGPTDLVTSVTQSGHTATIDWDLLSRTSKRTQPNTVSTEWTYNAAGFLTGVVSKRGTTPFDSHTYTHDNVGNILTQVRNGTTDSFQYDEIYRLTQATVNGTLYKYWYDLAGNRTQNQVGGNLFTYEYDPVNKCVTINGVAVQNDDNGNLTGFGTETYTWDVRNRLTKLVKGGATTEFQYDPLGMRSGKKVAGIWTYFLLDGDNVVKEITGGTSVYTTQGPVIDQPLARNGRYFTVNHLGSTTTLTDWAGTVVQSYSYGPFGETTQSTGEVNPIQYAGRENDGTGLYYNRARYYRPEWGRFISPDPIGFAGGINHYTYAANNPLGKKDPTGLLELPETPAGLGPDWTRDPSHGNPNDPDSIQRWRHRNGRDVLEWHKGKPGAPGFEGKNHWHEVEWVVKGGKGKWVKKDKHLLPGDKITDPVPFADRRLVGGQPGPSAEPMSIWDWLKLFLFGPRSGMAPGGVEDQYSPFPVFTY